MGNKVLESVRVGFGEWKLVRIPNEPWAIISASSSAGSSRSFGSTTSDTSPPSQACADSRRSASPSTTYYGVLNTGSFPRLSTKRLLATSIGMMATNR